MFSALLGAGLLARARQIMSGPMALAIAVTLAALVVVGGVAIGLAWLRGDAARDAAAVCEADKLQLALTAERSKTARLLAVQRERDETIERLTQQRQRDETTIADLTKERSDAVARATEWERRLGRRNDVVFRADDPWLRRAPAAGAPRSRSR